MTELRALTGARGVAAWLVVLYHVRASIPGLPASAEAVLAKGYLAVDFFFLLSGFVIWLTWHARVRQPGAISTFLRKRFARIWPLHMACLAFAVALALALRLTGRDDPAFPAADLPLHLLLVQSWGWTDPLHWNDPAWSISAEAAAYLLFPLLALGTDWRRWSAPALLALAAAILITLHLLMRGEPGLGADIARFALVRCLAEFTFGGIVCALWLRRPPLAAPLAVAAALLAAWAFGVPETLAAPAAFAALLLLLALTAGRPGNPLEVRALHALGEWSYATYLAHFLLWKVWKLALVSGPVTALQLGGYIVLVLAASALLYRWLELPAQVWINRAQPVRRRNDSPTPRIS